MGPGTDAIRRVGLTGGSLMIMRIAQFLRGISDFFRRIYGQLPRPVQTILAWISNQIIGTKIAPSKRKAVEGEQQANQPN